MAHSIPTISPLDSQKFLEVVNFQCAHLSTNLKSEERYYHGYLPYALTAKSLDAATRIDLSFGAFGGKKMRPVGFVCGLSHSMAQHVSYFEPVLQEFPSREYYPLFITLCVEKQYRRRSIGTELMERIIAVATKQQFATAVVDTGVGNDTACEFLTFFGFSQVVYPLLPDRTIFSKRLAPLS